jgi:hypothetical protein
VQGLSDGRQLRQIFRSTPPQTQAFRAASREQQADIAERVEMTAKYSLQPNERVILEAEPATRLRQSGSQPLTFNSQELVLTNQNIILITTGAFGKTKGTQYFPLDDIPVIDGIPRVNVVNKTGEHLLEVDFQSGRETFSFQRKKTLRAWADNIAKLRTGSSDDFSTARDRSIPGTAYVAESLKHTIGAFKTSFGLKSDSNLEKVARKCASCSAPISGVRGRIVRCEYCDSDQQL